jgi:hypothetical protein
MDKTDVTELLAFEQMKFSLEQQTRAVMGALNTNDDDDSVQVVHTPFATTPRTPQDLDMTCDNEEKAKDIDPSQINQAESEHALAPDLNKVDDAASKTECACVVEEVKQSEHHSAPASILEQMQGETKEASVEAPHLKTEAVSELVAPIVPGLDRPADVAVNSESNSAHDA